MKLDILLIASQPSEAAVILSMLDGDLFRCVTVNSYRQALAALCWDAYDAIICDEYLTDGSWKDIVGQVAALPQGPPVIVIATGIENDDREVAREMGAFELIAKPIDAATLLNALYAACSLACVGQHA